MPEAERRGAAQPRVVIMSDDPQYGKLLAYGLRLVGLSAALLAHDDDRSEAVARMRPDLMIIDMSIAVADGLTTLHRLRDGGVPILVLSGSDDRAFSVESLVAGAQDVLVKPVAFPAILERVNRLLGVRSTAGDGW